MGNDEYYKVEKNSIVITLFGELVIRYDMKSMTLEKYALLSITQAMQAYDSSYCQIDQSKIFMCGGLRRGHARQLSDFAAMFDCNSNDMLLFTPMQLPRHKHALVTLGDFAYAIGGITADSAYSVSVERFNFNTRGWEHVAPLTYGRQFPKACVSTNSNRLFLFGGCQSNDHNALVEVYDCQDNQWYLLGLRTGGEQALVLKEPFNSMKSWALMIEGRWSALM